MARTKQRAHKRAAPSDSSESDPPTEKQTARKSVPHVPTKQEDRLREQLRIKRERHSNTNTKGRTEESEKEKKEGGSPKATGRILHGNWLRQVRRAQRTADLMMPRMPFRRLVGDILKKQHGKNRKEGRTSSEDGYRIQSMAVDALQEAAEAYLVCIFEDAIMAAIHAKRVTVMPRDLDLIRRLRREK